MLSKNQIKLINSLQQKKYRNLQNLFIVEGEKGVNEFLESKIELHSLYYTDTFKLTKEGSQYFSVTEKDLKKISQLKTPNNVLAVFHKPVSKSIKEKGLTLVLDAIKDPGNLGTIIRLCDWFNVTQLICSLETVDCFNPKVVQATMGSLIRVPIVYTDIIPFLENTTTPFYVAMMEGDNIYKTTLPKEAILIMGNEADGISNAVWSMAKNRLMIPRINNSQKPESLNVATATAVLLSEFNRAFTQKLD